MINGVSGTSSLSYLWQLQHASKNTGMSAANLFSSLDTNGDSTISKSELSSALGSSSLTSSVLGSASDNTSSLVSFLEALTQAITNTTGSNGTDFTGRLSAEDMFNKTDTNADGGLDKTEFENGRPSDMTVAQADELYAKLDTNNDSSISKAEFTANGPGGQNGPPLPPHDSMGNASGSTNTSSSDASLTVSPLMQSIGKYVQMAAATASMAALVA